MGKEGSDTNLKLTFISFFLLACFWFLTIMQFKETEELDLRDAYES